MTAFTNLFGVKIEYKPFFQSCLSIWRVARYEHGELEQVCEIKGFDSYEECLKSIN
jgi:hypothetical protein